MIKKKEIRIEIGIIADLTDEQLSQVRYLVVNLVETISNELKVPSNQIHIDRVEEETYEVLEEDDIDVETARRFIL